MSDYTPAPHAHCHVCGYWVRLTTGDRKLMYRHRYGGASGSDYCVGGRTRVGEIISGFAGPYVRDPRPVEHLEAPKAPWWHDDYFRGYRSHLLHPHSPSTGSEGGCDICGGYSGNPMHAQPWRRLSEPDEAYLRWKHGDPVELPKPQFTDTRFAARVERLKELKAPAVSSPIRGESEKVVRRYPETDVEETGWGIALIRSKTAHGDINQEDHMNLNITTERGKSKTHRATIQSEDGSQGIFCESDDLATAIAQATACVLQNTTAGIMVGQRSAPDSPQRTVLSVATSQTGIKVLVRRCINSHRYVTIDYHSTTSGECSTGRKVFPLYETGDRAGFVAREQGKGARTFKWRGVERAQEFGT